MAYTTNAAVEARFESDEELGHLTKNVSARIADQAFITEARQAAEGYMDSKFAVHYRVPVTVTNSVVAATLDSCAVDLTIERMLADNGIMSELISSRAQRWRDWLVEIVERKAMLPVATIHESTGSKRLASFGKGEGDDRHFTRATMAKL